jgi:predicted RNase H-like HicB family nuclease
MTFTIEFEREDDGRWLAEVVELPGVLAYGQNSDEAIAKAQALALRVLADRLEHGESAPEFMTTSFAAARANGPQLKQSVSSRRYSAYGT